MAATYSLDKVQAATIDIQFNWASWLGTDTIASVAWTVTGLTAGTTANTTTTATQRVSGGTVGTAASVKCQITTAAGYVDERTVNITVVSSIEARALIKAPGATVAIPAPTWTDLGTDTITAYSWSAASGLTIASGGSSATVVVSGGTSGTDYALTCTITTASGQTDARVIRVQVRDR